MNLVRDGEVEALASEMLRQTIDDFGWYPSLPAQERRTRIDQDVDLHWMLTASDARKRLEQHQTGNSHS
jgi:hypothetical protein